MCNQNHSEKPQKLNLYRMFMAFNPDLQTPSTLKNSSIMFGCSPHLFRWCDDVGRWRGLCAQWLRQAAGGRDGRSRQVGENDGSVLCFTSSFFTPYPIPVISRSECIVSHYVDSYAIPFFPSRPKPILSHHFTETQARRSSLRRIPSPPILAPAHPILYSSHSVRLHSMTLLENISGKPSHAYNSVSRDILVFHFWSRNCQI